ncbi:MAG: purine-binding chemotaxis protein CheW [Nitrospinae bacterium]|nr:purine-binding chemotaxis protein CheW [Nitrospinota bacterium]
MTVNNLKEAAYARGGKYLTFTLGSETYGLEILKVREIIGARGVTITAVPQLPANARGVMNLRGVVIPIIDLRLKFNMAEKEYNRETCIIVLTVGSQLMGIAVDAVSEVLDIEEGYISPPPPFGASVSTDFILGMGKVKDKVVLLLDIGCVLLDISATMGSAPSLSGAATSN